MFKKSQTLATKLKIHSQGSEKPGFFKNPTRVGFFWVLSAFIGFWVFIGFFGRAVPAAVSKHGKGK